jgi:magnesium transporter
MIRSMYYPKNGKLRTDLQVKELPSLLQDSDGILWVDFEANPAQEDEKILREIFGFHPLAIEDALQESNVPKLDDWGDYLYIVLHAVTLQKEDGIDVLTQELDIFLGPNFIVTHHDGPIPALEHLRSILNRDLRYLQKDVDQLMYRIADDVVASYMPVVEEIDELVDQAEDEIFDHPTPLMLERIFALKRASIQLRRIIGPQREVMNKLARDDFLQIDARDRIYFRDVYDHLVRLYDISESLRDLVSGTLDTYLSVINNRMNDIMKTLTVITSLFMPISFLTGFFGMNFFGPVVPLERWTSYPAFLIALGIFIVVPVTMILMMRRRGWM